MTKVIIVNTLAADEAVIENAGNLTGPYASVCKFNAIAVPMPRTNIQTILAPGETLELEVEDVRDIAFFKGFNIPGLEVTIGDGTAEAAAVEPEVPAYSGEDETTDPTDPTDPVDPDDGQGE